MRRLVHVITPGDHFSPLTGSAVPTVVDGLCRGQPAGWPRPAVVVAEGTYPQRYDSADIIEYPSAQPLHLPSGLSARYLDAGLSLAGLPRLASRHTWAASVAGQDHWEPSIVLGHNAVQLMPLIDNTRHRGVLYAHNLLLSSYRPGEAGRTLRHVSRIVCVSNWLANRTSSRLPARLRDRVAVVHNGVDYQRFRRATPPARSGPLRVAFVGRMLPDKGADVLVKAVQLLRRPDIRLTLIGSAGFSAHDPRTPYEREIRQQVAVLDSLAEVRPFVPRDEVVRQLQQADVAVVPSRWPDPFPLTVLEGMAAGAVVIGSRIGGIPEAMGDAGILVPPDDPPALAEAIEALADDEEFWLSHAHRCQEHAEANDWPVASARLHHLLAAVD